MTVRTAFNPYVHGARGLFASMVFVFHIAHSGLPTFVFPGSDAVQWALLSLQYGVELFFGISGIVILGALSRASSLTAFAWDRFTRIYPVLCASLIVILGSGYLLGQALPDVRTILLNFAVPPPWLAVPMINPPAWSLRYEVLFYALCALGWTLRRRPAARHGVAALGAVLIAIFPRALLMPSGLLIATDRLRLGPLAWLQRHPLCVLVAFLLLWRATDLAAATGAPHVSIALMPVIRWLAFLPAIALAGLLGTAALAGIAAGEGAISRWLLTRPMQFMGTISYSFYLWHPLGLEIAKRVLGITGLLGTAGPFTQLLVFVIGAPLALMIATASQRVLEKRLTRWLRLRGPGVHREPVVTTGEASDRGHGDSAAPTSFERSSLSAPEGAPQP